MTPLTEFRLPRLPAGKIDNSRLQIYWQRAMERIEEVVSTLNVTIVSTGTSDESLEATTSIASTAHDRARKANLAASEALALAVSLMGTVSSLEGENRRLRAELQNMELTWLH